MSLRNKVFSTEYRTGKKDCEPSSFYKKAILKSNFYCRASGYFSSSIYDLFRYEIFKFAQKGGLIRLICSPVMSSDDLSKIKEGYDAKAIIEANLTLSIEEMAKNDSGEEKLSFASTLIRDNILEIKLALNGNGVGLFHDKTGYFRDENANIVSFNGSANESMNAFSGDGNFERLKVFCSWKENDENHIQEDVEYVEQLWENQVPGLNITAFPTLPYEQLLKYARNDLNNFSGVSEFVEAKDKQPLPLMDHQIEAIKNWEKANFKGILKHATGSGKTITAIAAIRKHTKSGFPVIVVVPSKLLVAQWYQELRAELDSPIIVRCGGGHSKWREREYVQNVCKSFGGLKQGGIIVTVSNTASSDRFIQNLSNIENILIVADEVHSLGSSQNSKILDKEFGKRLGLSATPERYSDPEGTEKILNFFGGILDPEVTLKDAMDNGRLVPYEYNPHIVPLSATEEDKYSEWTTKIANYIRFNLSGEDKFTIFKDPVVSNFFIQRSWVLKKANGKVNKISEIIDQFYNKGEHWLIYCQDSEQLNEINESLKEQSISPFIYHTDLDGDPEAELEAFTHQSGVMLSIRCLDEGIDIPKISHAIIAASSQNPREFIQRRGRVLRSSQDPEKPKLKAVIYDCLVAPSKLSDFDSIGVGELVRASEFAKTAMNARGALSTLENYAINVGLYNYEFLDLENDDEE